MIYGDNYLIEGDTLSYIYAHGELESLLGSDLLVTKKREYFAPGIHKVTVKGKNEYDCLMFVWNAGFNRGLVVLLNDARSIQYAVGKLLNKSSEF